MQLKGKRKHTFPLWMLAIATTCIVAIGCGVLLSADGVLGPQHDGEMAQIADASSAGGDVPSSVQPDGNVYGAMDSVSPEDEAFTVSALYEDVLCERDVVLVELAEGSTADEIASSLEASSGMAGFSVRDENSGFVAIKLPDGFSVDEALVQLSQFATVNTAQPNFVYFAQGQDGGDAAGADTAPTANLSASRLLSTGLETQAFDVNDPGSSQQWAIEAMNLKEAWSIAKGAGAISDKPGKINRTVAVIDEGFEIGHADFAGCVVDTYDSYRASQGVSGASLADVSPTEAGDHGTHAAGIVGAVANNGIGVAGVSYNAQLQLIRASKAGSSGAAYFTSESLAKGVEHVIETAPRLNTHVISMSVGGKAAESDFDTVLTRAIDKAMKNDIVVVCSAGNKTTSAAPYVNYPSDYSPVVSVINIAQEGNGTDEYSRASTSNYNRNDEDWSKDISAPGTSIYGPNDDGGYGWKSGTSMAAPHVAGVVSLMFAVNSDLSAADAIILLYSTATDLNTSANRTGTTFDNETGYGLVNAEAAVRAALEYVSNSEEPQENEEPKPPAVTPPATERAFSLSRISGNTALDTMRKIVSIGKWDVGGTVVLVTSEGYWDGLTANGVAGLANAPIVMTDSGVLSSQARAVISSLKPKTIVICGGVDAVSRNVEQAAVRAAGTTPRVMRLWGQAADDTANRVFSGGPSVSGGSWQTIGFICTDNGYWDALSVAPISYNKHWPIFLTQQGGVQLSSETIAAMKSGGITKVYVIGGTKAVGPYVLMQLRKANISVVDRIYGQTAVDTSSKVAQFAVSQGLSANNLGVATNNGYWDALAGAAYCGKMGAALIVVDGPQSTTISNFAKQNKSTISQAYIFGGEKAVTVATENAIKKAVS